MSILMSINIHASVGSGGTNELNDVRVVQQQLNGLMNPPRARLSEDGKSGRKTIGAIQDFQRNVLNFKKPDGRVDPGGKTLRALNDPGSEGVWAKMSMMPEKAPSPAGGPPDVPGPKAGALYLTLQQFQRSLSLSEKRNLDQLLQTAMLRTSPQVLGGLSLLDQLAQEYYTGIKHLLACQGVTQYTIEFLEGLDNLKRSGFSARHIAKTLGLTITSRHHTVDGWIQSCRAMKGNPAVKKVLTYVGDRAAALGVLFAIFDSLPHFAKGDFGPAMAELYAGFIAYGVPIGGAINAATTILGDLQPQVKNNPYIHATFDLIRALDPINAGKVAVDLQWSYIKLSFTWVASGKYPLDQVQEFVDRINASPMGFWNEGGKIWQEILGG